MKNNVLSTVILVYVVFVTFRSIVFFLSIYRQALDESYCECESLSPEEVRERVDDEAQEGELKWIAAFFAKKKTNLSNHFDYYFFCTGTVISKLFVMTSARCFEEQSLKWVYATAGYDHHLDHVKMADNRRRIKALRLHPDYAKIEKEDSFLYQNNLALVQLNQPFDMNKENLFPACLMEQNFTIEKELLTADYVLDNQENRRKLMMMPMAKVVCEYDDLICAAFPERTDACLDDHHGISLSYELDSGNESKFFMIGVESFRIASKHNHSSNRTCDPLSTVVFEPVLPHFDWIVEELNAIGDPMCLSSQFRLTRKELLSFGAMLTVATAAFVGFLVVRHYRSSADDEVDERPEAVYNQKSTESLDKANVPKMLKNGPSNSQSSD